MHQQAVVSAGVRRIGALVLLLCAAASAQANGPYLNRSEVRSFMDEMHTTHGMEMAELERVMGAVRYQPRVVKLIGAPRPVAAKPAPAPKRSYPAYQRKFLTPSRIAAGVHYWETHEEYLRRAEETYGVPAEVILGILGVETAYGQNTGSFRVVDALASIAFDGKRRQDYFREELKEFLLMTRETGLDPLEVKGSYAGAMGLPQFMPSSYRKHAVDFDGDGRVDLAGSPADAIGSVASYLQAHGWVAGQPGFVPVKLPAAARSELVSGLERVHTVAVLQQKGVKFKADCAPEEVCSIVELPVPKGQAKYVAGFSNFEAITRYNRSTFYASAVLDLAGAVREARLARMAAQL